jgi:integrase
LPQYSKELSKGLRWYFKFDFQNHTYRSDAIYLTKIAARKAEGAKFKEVTEMANDPSLKQIPGLFNAITERLDTLKIKKSEKYYKESKRYLKQLLNYFGDISMNKVFRKDINKMLLEYSSELQDNGCDNYAVNAMIRCYKALYYQIIDDHELSINNPFARLDLFSINRQLKYIPRDDEIEIVLGASTLEQRVLVEFVRDTAARINEPLRMRGNDVLDNEVVLYTRKSKNSDLVPRKVPKPACLQNRSFKPDELVFPYWKSRPKFLERHIEKLELQTWNWHNLRHRQASKWSKEGKPLFEIMTLLGHSNMETTQKYLQLIA